MKLVFGIRFSPLREHEVATSCAEPIAPGSGPRLVVTTNLDHVVNLLNGGEYRAAYSWAWLATADGWPVYLYARLRGVPIPERVPGADLVHALIDALEPSRHRVFIIGSSDETCRRFAGELRARGFAPDAVQWAVPPLGFDADAARSRSLATGVAAHGTTHLLMGLGSPKSEVWVYRHRNDLGDLYAFGFGAGLDFLVGTQRRAPLWMRRIGMEWFWRLASEPRRLARRYLVTSWRFFVAIKQDLEQAGNVGPK